MLMRHRQDAQAVSHGTPGQGGAMLGRYRAIMIAVSAATLFAAGFAEGQRVPCTTPACWAPGPQEVAHGLRAEAVRGRMDHHALHALLQLWRAHPPAELEALADSIMAVGTDLAAEPGPGGHTIGEVAANMLLSAAIWRRDPSGKGTRYMPAVDRAAEMAYRLPGGDVGIINQLRPIIGDDQWVAYMRRFATSNLTPSAGIAVLTLEWEGPMGVEVLRELYDDDLVHEPRARWRLRELAKSRGWG